MIPKFLIIALFVGSACAATWMGYLPMKPKEFENKEGCYIKEINDVIPFGTTVSPIGICYRIHCDGQMIDYASCGVVGTDDSKCYITEEDVSKPYPQCCPDVKCDVDNNII